MLAQEFRFFPAPYLVRILGTVTPNLNCTLEAVTALRSCQCRVKSFSFVAVQVVNGTISFKFNYLDNKRAVDIAS